MDYSQFPISKNTEDQRDDWNPLARVYAALGMQSPTQTIKDLRDIAVHPFTPLARMNYPWLMEPSTPSQMSIDSGFNSQALRGDPIKLQGYNPEIIKLLMRK